MKGQEDLDALGDGGEVDLDTLPPGFQLPPPPQALGEGEEVLNLHEASCESQGSDKRAPKPTRRLEMVLHTNVTNALVNLDVKDVATDAATQHFAVALTLFVALETVAILWPRHCAFLPPRRSTARPGPAALPPSCRREQLTPMTPWSTRSKQYGVSINHACGVLHTRA